MFNIKNNTTAIPPIIKPIMNLFAFFFSLAVFSL